MFERELAAAIGAANAAYRVLARVSLDPSEETLKAGAEIVTAMDIEAERAAVSLIHQAFPDDLIVSEEMHAIPEDATRQTRRWYLDPLDGTTNFVMGRTQWGVSVAFADADGHVRAAVIQTSTGTIFSATLGGGAFRDGRKITVCKQVSLAAAVVGSGFPYVPGVALNASILTWGRLVPLVRGVRCTGASALSLCEVASCQLDAFCERDLQRWDVAAGILIATEAGATVTDFDGRPPTPFAADRVDVLAAAPQLHKDLLRFLQGASS